MVAAQTPVWRCAPGARPTLSQFHKLPNKRPIAIRGFRPLPAKEGLSQWSWLRPRFFSLCLSPLPGLTHSLVVSTSHTWQKTVLFKAGFLSRNQQLTAAQCSPRKVGLQSRYDYNPSRSTCRKTNSKTRSK